MNARQMLTVEAFASVRRATGQVDTGVGQPSLSGFNNPHAGFCGFSGGAHQDVSTPAVHLTQLKFVICSLLDFGDFPSSGKLATFGGASADFAPVSDSRCPLGSRMTGFVNTLDDSGLTVGFDVICGGELSTFAAIARS